MGQILKFFIFIQYNIVIKIIMNNDDRKRQFLTRLEGKDTLLLNPRLSLYLAIVLRGINL